VYYEALKAYTIELIAVIQKTNIIPVIINTTSIPVGSYLKNFEAIFII
jgi:hypothetical protein